MLIQKTISYILARGLPGLISLLSIMVYTRILSPQIYGQYAIVMSLVVLTITMCFQWMQFSLLRFYPKADMTEQVLISNITITYIVFAVIILPIFVAVLWLSLDFLTPTLLIIILLLTFCHGFFDISIQISVSRGEALYYGLLLFFKATLGLLIGVMLFYLGYQLAAPLSGLAVAYFILLVFLVNKYFKSMSWRLLDKKLIKSMMRYGIPLSGTFLMNFIMSNSDRLMLAWMKGEESAGLYSAGYDLSNFAFIVLLMSIHLAFYPMIVEAYEKNDNKQSKVLLEQNIVILFLISIVPIILFTFLVMDFSQLVFGQEFWNVASNVIPIISIATLFLGLKAYYFDLAFLLTHKTNYLLLIGLAGALLNIILNYFFIQQWGILGAAYATCLCYFVILCLSYTIGRSILSLPLPLIEISKVIIVFMVNILLLNLSHGFLFNNIFFDLLILLFSYVLMIYYFNFLDCRSFINGVFILKFGRKTNVL